MYLTVLHDFLANIGYTVRVFNIVSTASVAIDDITIYTSLLFYEFGVFEYIFI